MWRHQWEVLSFDAKVCEEAGHNDKKALSRDKISRFFIFEMFARL